MPSATLRVLTPGLPFPTSLLLGWTPSLPLRLPASRSFTAPLASGAGAAQGHSAVRETDRQTQRVPRQPGRSRSESETAGPGQVQPEPQRQEPWPETRQRCLQQEGRQLLPPAHVPRCPLPEHGGLGKFPAGNLTLCCP